MNHGETLALHVGIIVLVAVAIHVVVRRAVRHLVKAAEKRAEARGRSEAAGAPSGESSRPELVAGAVKDRSVARTATLGHGLNLLVDAVLAVVVVLTVLSEFGIALGPILASLGIGGIALGFGAQTLVKDVISGIFLVLEDQIGLGDVITVGQLTGTVESVGLRVTRLHDPNGEIWYVRNGEIATLGNKTQGWSTTQVEVTAPVTGDPFRVLALLRDVAATLNDDPAWNGLLLKPAEVLGLTGFDATQMTFALRFTSPPAQQGGVERELRARVLQALQSDASPTA